MKKYLLSIGLLLVSLVCQASFNEGVVAYERGDYQTALKAWQAVAEQKPAISGDFEWHTNRSKNIADAQYGLGLLYWQGKGVTQDYHVAEKWLTLAAKSGHSEAQLKLAYLHLTGLNGHTNAAEARKWFEKSAQQGNVDAQYNLGLLYLKGLGVSPNRVHAKKWLTSAAKQGDPAAKKLLAEINAPATQVATPITSSQTTAQAEPAVIASTPAVVLRVVPKPTQTAPVVTTPVTPARITVNAQPVVIASPPTPQVAPKQTQASHVAKPATSTVVTAKTQPTVISSPDAPKVASEQSQAAPVTTLAIQPLVTENTQTAVITSADASHVTTQKMPVAPVTTLAVSPLPTENAQPVATPPLTSVATRNTTQTVDTQPPSSPPLLHDYYAIQLLASAKQNDVVKLMEKWRNNLSPLIITDKVKNNEQFFILAYGNYSSMDEAKQAIGNLPPELKKSRPWAVKLNAPVNQVASKQTQTAPVAGQVATPSTASVQQPAVTQSLSVTNTTPAPNIQATNDDTAIEPPKDSLAETSASANQISPKQPQVTPLATQTASAPVNDYHAIQLFASANQNDVVKLMEKWQNSLSPLRVMEKTKNHVRIFILAYGNYSSAAEAKQAIGNLPSELKKTRPWTVKINISTNQVTSKQIQPVPAPAITSSAVISSPSITTDDVIKDAVSAEPRFPLSGSKWHYIDEGWQYDLEFAANGVLLTTHPKDKTKDDDTWEQNGDDVSFYFNNKFSHFKATLSTDNLMSGTATNKKGKTWTWAASRAD